jgi:competence protein ComEC
MKLPFVFWFAAACTTPLLSAAPGDDLLRVHFIDVGQGDAIWIQGPKGAGSAAGLNIMIDGGPDRKEKNRILTYLNKYGLGAGAQIDYLVSTHPHDDHYPGLIDVLDRYLVKTIVDPGFPKEGPKYAEFVATAEKEVGAAKDQFVKLRQTPAFRFPSFGADLRLRILHADITDLTDAGSKQNTKENNASIVLRLEYKSFSFLLMGDAEGKERQEPAETTRFVEGLLVKQSPQDLRATVLKAAHHGSETGSTLSFIRAVQPEIVVIMSGRKSFKGTFLPDASVIQRYRSERPGITVVRTDQSDAQEGLTTTNDADGDDILIFTDGDSLQVSQSRKSGAKRRWVKIKTLQWSNDEE